MFEDNPQQFGVSSIMLVNDCDDCDDEEIVVKFHHDWQMGLVSSNQYN